MEEAEFDAITEAAWDAMPEKFKVHIENVALLVEDEPSEELRTLEGLGEGETLLGHYHGIPNTARGSEYGVGVTLPDTITLYRLPILDAADEMTHRDGGEFLDNVTTVVRETLWHEIGHYFGLDEHPINEREAEGTNKFES
ncbi:MAG TPA: metallopeptidase family protein [Candidatus Paceibacterota bacterium]|nr:metallopeptidase family protein [Candidatus Paceibacterota bacterium]